MVRSVDKGGFEDAARNSRYVIEQYIRRERQTESRMGEPYSQIRSVESELLVVAKDGDERYLQRYDEQCDDRCEKRFPPAESEPRKTVSGGCGYKNRNNDRRKRHRYARQKRIEHRRASCDDDACLRAGDFMPLSE